MNQKETQTNNGQRQIYSKAESFLNISGTEEKGDALLRLINLRENIGEIPQSRRKVVADAIDDVLDKSDRETTGFVLRPHIIEELKRVSDGDLARYLFYRYRYDINPEKKILDDFPPCIQIEPTSICNYRCVFCYQTDNKLTQGRHGHMGMMSLDTFKLVVDQVETEVEAVTLASRGEPLMAKEIVSMLEYVSGKFLGLKINTNASFLNEEKAHALLAAEPNTLVFSADASTKELYGELRVNGDLDTVLSNVKRFNDIKQKHYPKSKTIVRVSGVRYSEEQRFSDIEAFWKDYVDQVAFVAYNPWESAYDAAPNNIVDHCSDLWRRTFVWWDGKVNPCDVDYRSTLSAGNIMDQSISEIWKNDSYENLRHHHTNGKRCDLSPCSGCMLV